LNPHLAVTSNHPWAAEQIVISANLRWWRPDQDVATMAGATALAKYLGELIG
jgi:hypothetical protein